VPIVRSSFCEHAWQTFGGYHTLPLVCSPWLSSSVQPWHTSDIYAMVVTVHMFVVVHRFIVCVCVCHGTDMQPFRWLRQGWRGLCILRGVVEGKVVGPGVAAMAALPRVLMVCKPSSLARPAAPYAGLLYILNVG
jgi:hypothetical protein